MSQVTARNKSIRDTILSKQEPQLLNKWLTHSSNAEIDVSTSENRSSLSRNMIYQENQSDERYW